MRARWSRSQRLPVVVAFREQIASVLSADSLVESPTGLLELICAAALVSAAAAWLASWAKALGAERGRAGG